MYIYYICVENKDSLVCLKKLYQVHDNICVSALASPSIPCSFTNDYISTTEHILTSYAYRVLSIDS
jgi:hypothetical protein